MAVPLVELPSAGNPSHLPTAHESGVLVVSSAPTKVNAQQERFLLLVAGGGVTQQRAYEVTYGVILICGLQRAEGACSAFQI